ncbi:MAG: hypothetical protein WA208_01840 [Thermoanaerobaculia bacterium]
MVGVGVTGQKGDYHPYLATAAHNVRRAQDSASPLLIRYNTTDGGSVVEETTTNWYFHPDPAVDLAVLPFDPPASYEVGLIPAETFAFDELLEKHYFGTGDEVMAVGLFYFRHGKKRNLPVLRSGIVASMPTEPFIDDHTGAPYDAYLIEMRSFGGLSGTPIFTVIHEGSLLNRPGRVFSPLVHRLTLVGVVRGHWDVKASGPSADAEIEQANIGLTIATPAQKLAELLLEPELCRLRRKDEAAMPPISEADPPSA